MRLGQALSPIWKQGSVFFWRQGAGLASLLEATAAVVTQAQRRVLIPSGAYREALPLSSKTRVMT